MDLRKLYSVDLFPRRKYLNQVYYTISLFLCQELKKPLTYPIIYDTLRSTLNDTAIIKIAVSFYSYEPVRLTQGSLSKVEI